MFIFNKDTHLNLIDYGIEVPLLGQRGLVVLDFIKETYPEKLLFQLEIENPTKQTLRLAHTDEFIKNLYNDPTKEIMEAFELIKEDGSYHRYNPKETNSSIEDLREKMLKQVSGTIKTCEFAQKHGFSFHLGGGLHHAMKDRGRGFCLVNDIVIAARHMQKKYALKKIWVIDVDAHKGDGTAALTLKDKSITTLSIHMKNGWPLDMGDGTEEWFVPSDIDIPVSLNDDYNEYLFNGLKKLETYPRPDLCIVVQGSDPYEFDELESSELLKLTRDQMLKRDMLVFNFLKDLNIPQAYVMVGGYGKRAHEPYINFLKYLNNFQLFG